MHNNILKWLGLCAMAVIIFICAVIAIRWAINFIAWTELDSGWAQAIGSVAALGVAIFVMHMQATRAETLARDIELRSLLRQANSVRIILDKMLTEISSITPALMDRQTAAQSLLEWKDAKIFIETSHVLNTVPVHALGSAQMVSGFMEIKEAANTLSDLLNEAKTIFDNGQTDPQQWNVDAIVRAAGYSKLRSKIAYSIYLKGVEKLSNNQDPRLDN
ncbi:hypothetical protein [Janthinobacterium tructae]|uniref:Uncharacterized protein n=1 Tax=Janthinobacterium tructae TaxID=2590869 RepID=A0A4Y6R8V4_9BURK|nr:hypothetical protein [Janthinobacterium tructae]QDG69401.1 hypothetical protein FJQ89_02460 [Janthinobacterium tructae]